jgi:hypothetical protein
MKTNAYDPIVTIENPTMTEMNSNWICVYMLCSFTDPSKCINDQTLRSDTEFCRTSLLKSSDKCSTKLLEKCPTKLSDKILTGRSESLQSQIVKV